MTTTRISQSASIFFAAALTLILSVSPLLATSAEKDPAPAATKSEKSGSIASKITLSKEELMNKIKGAWAGQVIGCTYGGPTEFRWRAAMIPDSENIAWGDADYVERTMKRSPGLYDDVYMDLTFVDAFERLGIDAPVDSIALAFAHAGYPLWHANQAARYNILRGIMPPMSGHWHNNPHANDIDYQIEADYAGIMSPAMPNSASEISDRVGHIMNYGDGWYGGVYIGAMYALAFATDDIETIVCEALKTIPAKSNFYQAISRVIEAYRAYPNDWKKCWQLCQEQVDGHDLCPEGMFAPINIDVTVNCAYVIMGLLYGKGDFGRTLDISTRCGQDSDCNPASAGGILATAMGYSNIPEEWLAPLKRAEDIDFAYTTISLNDTYKMSYSHALQMIERGGGKITDNEVIIKSQKPKAVRFEESFEGLTQGERMPVKATLSTQTRNHSFSAECAAITITGRVHSAPKDYVAELEVEVDGEKEVVRMPAIHLTRRLDIYWNYSLNQGNHNISIRWTNPVEGAKVECHEAVLMNKSK
ncbi:MAG: ADP-ribosylglycohydrolase family protein [Alistipes sp.]|nr:ADP-ribosylglycohydrolase family protein [Alistipes sp.]